MALDRLFVALGRRGHHHRNRRLQRTTASTPVSPLTQLSRGMRSGTVGCAPTLLQSFVSDTINTISPFARYLPRVRGPAHSRHPDNSPSMVNWVCGEPVFLVRTFSLGAKGLPAFTPAPAPHSPHARRRSRRSNAYRCRPAWPRRRDNCAVPAGPRPARLPGPAWQWGRPADRTRRRC